MQACAQLLIVVVVACAAAVARATVSAGEQSQETHASSDTGAYVPAYVVESGPAASAYVADVLIGTPAAKYRMRVDFSVDYIAVHRDLRSVSSSYSADRGGTDLVYFNAHHHRLPVVSDPGRRTESLLRAQGGDGTLCATCDGVLGLSSASSVWLAYPAARFSSASITLGWARSHASLAHGDVQREEHRESLFSSISHHHADTCMMRCAYDYDGATNTTTTTTTGESSAANVAYGSALCSRDAVNITFVYPDDAVSSNAGSSTGVYRVVFDPSRAYTYVPDEVYARYMRRRNAYASSETASSEWEPLWIDMTGACYDADSAPGEDAARTFRVAVRPDDVIDTYENTDMVQLSLAPARLRPGYAEASDDAQQLEFQRTVVLGGSVMWHQFVSTKDARDNTMALARHESRRAISVPKLALFLVLFLSLVRWKMTNPVVRPDREDEASPGETAWNCASQLLSACSALALMFDGFVAVAVRDIRVLQVGTAVSVSVCVVASACAAFAYWFPRARKAWRTRHDRAPDHAGWNASPFASFTARRKQQQQQISQVTTTANGKPRTLEQEMLDESRYAVEFMRQVSSSFKYNFVRNSTHDVLTLTAMWLCLLERRLEFVGTLFTAAVNVYMTYTLSYFLGILVFFFMLAQRPAMYMSQAELQRREAESIARRKQSNAAALEAGSFPPSRFAIFRRRAWANVAARATHEAHNVFFGGTSVAAWSRASYSTYMLVVFPALYVYNVYVPYRHFVYPIVQRNAQVYVDCAGVITTTIFAFVVVLALVTGRLMVRNCMLRKLEEEVRLHREAALAQAQKEHDEISAANTAMSANLVRGALHHRIGASTTAATGAHGTRAANGNNNKNKTYGNAVNSQESLRPAMSSTMMMAGAVTPAHGQFTGGISTSFSAADVIGDMFGAL